LPASSKEPPPVRMGNDLLRRWRSPGRLVLRCVRVADKDRVVASNECAVKR
jgi:hypothetical protein